MLAFGAVATLFCLLVTYWWNTSVGVQYRHRTRVVTDDRGDDRSMHVALRGPWLLALMKDVYGPSPYGRHVIWRIVLVSPFIALGAASRVHVGSVDYIDMQSMPRASSKSTLKETPRGSSERSQYAA